MAPLSFIWQQLGTSILILAVPGFASMPFLYKTLRGIKSSLGISKQARFPITIYILDQIYATLKPYIPLLLAAFTLASLFFCGANSLVMAILTFSPVLPGPISRSNPTFSIQSILLLPFQETAKFTRAKSIWNVCAVTALQDYLLQTLHHKDRQPLFQFANGHNLTWTALTNNLPGLLHVCGLDSTHYASHSFKIEAATTVRAAGICDWLIKVLGRRKSDAYQSSRLLKRHYFKSHRTWLQALCTNDFPLSLRTL